MKTTRGLMRSVAAAALGVLALLPATGYAQQPKADAKLPALVRKTFEARFPKAEIQKVEAEEEGGVTVYDIEFKDGSTEKETDITADGTMLEFTVVIDAKSVPEAAMTPIKKAAEGAAMKRIERIEITHETKDGKVVKLPKTLTHYAVELTKGTQSAEIVVDSGGKVIEEAKWSGGK
jgi:uncharacterized membrane protein YkoI